MKIVRKFIDRYLGIIIVCGCGILLVIIFIPNFTALQGLRGNLNQMQKKLIFEERRNRLFQEELFALENDAGYIEKIAREKLGWAGKEETIYRFSQSY